MYFQFFLAALLIIIFISSSVKVKKTRQEIVQKPSPHLGNEALLSYAATLSKQDEIMPGKRGISFLLSRMQENYRYIAAAYRRLNKSLRDKKRVSDNAEWLFDNFYIIEQQTRQISLSIKKKNYATLPIIRSGAYHGYPRIFALVHELVSHTDSVVNQDTLINFVNVYQKNLRLRDEEIWSLETMIRIALIENIRMICNEIMETQEQYEAAGELSKELWNVRDRRDKITEILREHFRFFETEESAFLEELVSGLRKRGNESKLILSILKDRLNRLGMDIEDITMLEHQKQAQRHISLGNAITSLRTLLNMNFTYVFEQLSTVEHILLSDPTGIYPIMDKSSKNHYRLLVNNLAKKCNMSEIEAAKQAIQLASEYEGLDERKRHVGYYLKKQNLQFDKRPAIHTKKRRFITLLISFSAILSFLFGAISFILTQKMLLSISLGIVVFFPIEAIVQNILQYVLTKTVKPQLIPKLELADGIPDNAKTLVVISTLLTSETCADELTEKILMYSKANPEKNLYFGILSDFSDSDEEITPADNAALTRLKSNIKQLQNEYGNFYLFHRRRTYHQADKKYMGNERKRGALCELNALITDGDNGTFSDILGNRQTLYKMRYIITLDSDTRLTLGSAKQLVGAMLHPLNRPVLNAAGTKVEDGYGLLQPRVSIDVKDASHSMFAGIFAGQGGIEPYSNTISDIYQDLFEEGSYTGKGIYDVSIFKQVLGKAIPDNTVLSHDLLEGNYIRCGLVSDIILVDGFPWRFQSYAKREHRWLRGDWQLFRWLFSRVQNKYGRKIVNPLGALEKWKIFDNLRRSLVKPALLISLFAAFCLPFKLEILLGGIVLIALLSNLFIATVEWFAGRGYQFTSQRFHATMVHGLEGAFYQTLIQFIILPYEAYLTIDAIVRVGWRSLISHKKLLEWTTAEQAQNSSKNTVLNYYKTMFTEVLAGILLTVVAPFSGPAYIIAGLWLLTPWVMFLISRPYQKKVYKLTKPQKEFLESLSKRIWQYFSDFTNAKNNFLPPDNYQENPPNGIAPRTSPTNIGLFLVAALSAYDLKIITLEELLERLEKTISSIQNLPKWRGQLYNWYNTQTAQPLRPTYISAVDNGNYLAYLMTLEQGLKMMEGGEYQPRIEQLIVDIHTEIENTDFSPLYDRERKLFYIGYHCEDGKPDNSHYDLLASEARQLSYIAVANGSVPKEHWFELGRTLTESGPYRGLVSWTGTMFEYLMPLLIMKNIPNTLLDETYRFVLYCQRKYGAKRNIPWGTSESGFYSFDMELNYQYRAFGVPELGLKYGLSEDAVISPYSTIMALTVDPKQALENLERLDKMKLIGKYGFYEAADFTPGRIPYGEEFGIVRSYMAHHLGMSILAINNVLHDNIMQNRFHHNVQIKAAEELLEERIPTRVIVTKDNKTTLWPLEQIESKDETAVRTIEKISLYSPSVHLLTNGKMNCLLTDTGLGYAKLRDVCMNRFRFDFRQPNGMFIYLKNIKTKQIWSPTAAPINSIPDDEHVLFYPHKAEYFRIENGIESVTQFVISAEHHVLLQTITLNNQQQEEVVLDITSYTEPLLNNLNADLAHRAFQNLFIQTAYDEANCTLYAMRRRKESDIPNIAYVSMLTQDGNTSDISYETDRMRFLGRNHTVANPKMILEGTNLSKTTGDVLDPILSLCCRAVIPPDESVKITLIYGMACDVEEAAQTVSLYRDTEAIKRTINIAQMRSRSENEFLNFSAKQQILYWDLLSRILFRFLKPVNKISALKQCQQTLWKYGISGDLPIIGITAEGNHYEPVQELLNAHEFLQTKGIQIDLIIIGKTNGSYRGANHQELLKLTSPHTREYCRRTRGVYLLSSANLEEEETEIMKTVSALWFHDQSPYLREQFPPIRQNKYGKTSSPKIPAEENDFSIELPKLSFYNSYGGFAKDEQSYYIKLKHGVNTPLPWVNVIAGPKMGTVVSETGGGYTWSQNCHENRLTPWYNDYVTDIAGEELYLLDTESRTVFSPFPKSIRDKNDTIIKHGFGYTEFSHKTQKILQTATVFVAQDNPVKICILKLKNESPQPKTLLLTHYIEPICGTNSSTPNHLELSHEENTFVVKNSFRSEFPNSKILIGYSERIVDFTCSQEEFAPKQAGIPAGVTANHLSCCLEVGQRLCIAARNQIDLSPGEEKQVIILLAESSDSTELQKIYEKYSSPSYATQMLQNVKTFWKNLTETVQVKTPDNSLDLMLNGWLLYQTLSCRIWGRSGYFQSGGAYGFRDQLQDSMGLLYAAPELTRKQILKHAAHQFEEGDVQHWWHEEDREDTTHKGIRTKMSDDFLWLPYVTAVYLSVTEDESILSEMIPYLKAQELEEEDERYFHPEKSELQTDLYQHCLRAIRRSFRFGTHNLPLIGSGDWNDGMNRIGNKGKGESVWLGWFLIDVLNKFIPICEKFGDKDSAKEFQDVLNDLSTHINENAWDGEWYRRAFFDDGSPVGSAMSTECKIDSIAQSWSVISGGGTKEYTAQAMESLKTHLIDSEHGIVKLLTPPFEGKDKDPGYIANYLAGIRENGGQYTHAATWAAKAFALRGHGETAVALLHMINPINHSQTQFEADVYKTEPYVISADVYSNIQHQGRSGWSWYTGAAAWYLRVAIEDVLGLHKKGKNLIIDPCISPDWEEYMIKVRLEEKCLHIHIQNPNRKTGLHVPFTIPLNKDTKVNYTIILDKN